MNSFRMKVPDKIKLILNKLQDAGFEAYVVGGCVRDTLLGETPHDWDITTSANPEEIQGVFRQYQQVLTGMKHGTIMVILSGEMIEITTYRVDGDYSDGRRPDNVSFTKNIKEDLARRDFTINACAATDTELVDPFHGSDDLDRCLIRCVGDPTHRFTEDSLRILRGIRFASVLGFEVEEETKKAMFKSMGLLKNVSQERITVEFCKALLGTDVRKTFLEFQDIFAHIIPEIKPMMEFNQNNRHHIYNVYEHSLLAVEAIAPDLILRSTMFFHDIAKPHCYTQDEAGEGHFYGHPDVSTKMTQKILLTMRFSNADISAITELVKYHDITITPTTIGVKRLLNKIGEEQLRRLLKVKRADAAAKNLDYLEKATNHILIIEQLLDEIIAQNACFSLKDLAINGDDLMAHGVPRGIKIGLILTQLLELVIQEDLENQKDMLLDKALKLLELD